MGKEKDITEKILFDMNLEREVIEKFRSDFKIVADFFWCKRNKNEYEPRAETIKHVDEVLKLLSALTQDERFCELDEEKLPQKGAIKMCDIINQFINKGREEGLKEGREGGLKEGREEGAARLGKLVDKLLSSNRLSDISRVTKDTVYRDTLYREYGI